MCGINGFSWGNKELIERMNYLARFRGPDGSGTYTDSSVSLGSTRLAIIDLSEKGNQPMSNTDGSIWMVFNGEIYNYQSVKEKLKSLGHNFVSDSDTEVIIRAYEEYGLDCFNYLNGMWGLAIYDKKNQRLILSRDRFGVKPLYYFVDGNRLIFSSMLGAFSEHDIETEPNDQVIMEYLAFNLTQHSEQTFFSKVLSLPPGHALTFNLKSNKHKITRWYQPQPKQLEDLGALRQLFSEAVRWRTVSDVPVGVCLSGGLDSSAITCILDKALPSDFNAFSLVAPGSRVDESRYIDEVVRYTGAKPFSTQVDPGTFLEEAADFIAAMEEPVTGLSAYAQYRVFKLAHEQGAKVLLDGQGGDELFAGYVYYWGYFFLELFKARRYGLLLKNMVLGLFKFKQIFPYSLFFFLLLPSQLRDWVWKHRLMTWIDHDFLKQTCGNEKDPRWKPTPLRELLNLTLFSTSIPHNLVWGDKSSMRWSVECREPFMDYELVHAAMAIEPSDLLVDGETKVMFREAIKADLPELIYNRKDKIGFAAPEEEFFRNPGVIEFSERIIYSESFKGRPYWDWQKINRIFAAHKAGTQNAGELIWKWINLELWLREFFSPNGERASIRTGLPRSNKTQPVPIST